MHIWIATVLFLLAAAPAQAQQLTSCDWEAAHPSDPDHVGPGRSSDDVDTAKAIEACRRAIETNPDVARFHYQLGRALVYHADRTGGDAQLGMPHLERAAELGSPQAMFVYGLMHKRYEDVCAAEAWIKSAADAQLKAGRITYANDYLAGAYKGCPPSAGPPEIRAYLEGASSQVSGYYEGLLLGILDRQLTRLMDKPED